MISSQQSYAFFEIALKFYKDIKKINDFKIFNAFIMKYLIKPIISILSKVNYKIHNNIQQSLLRKFSKTIESVLTVFRLPCNMISISFDFSLLKILSEFIFQLLMVSYD